MALENVCSRPRAECGRSDSSLRGASASAQTPTNWCSVTALELCVWPPSLKLNDGYTTSSPTRESGFLRSVSIYYKVIVRVKRRDLTEILVVRYFGTVRHF
jgi:hypothetical protein